MKIVLASRNRPKITELQTLLREYFPDVQIMSLDDIGYRGDIEETGTTFAENARIKAKVAASTGLIGMGDDSGLAVDALGGAPGVWSARYAGDHGDDEANNQLVLKNLEDKKDRSAAFVCHLCCVFPDGEILDAEGRVCGEILHEYHGSNGFGYDPLFYYPPFGKAFAELSPEEKNSVSHRRRAMKEMAEKIQKKLCKGE